MLIMTKITVSYVIWKFSFTIRDGKLMTIFSYTLGISYNYRFVGPLVYL
jgi:hypothetical protein